MAETGEKTRHAHDALLDVLATAVSQLVLSDRPVELLGPIFKELAEEFGVEFYFNYMRTEPDARELELESSAGLSAALIDQYGKLRFGEFVCGVVAEAGRPVIINDLQHSTFPGVGPLAAVGVQAYAGHPLIAYGRVLGTLAFATRKRTRFTDDELRLMKTIADLVSAVIMRNDLDEKLRESEERFRVLVEASSQAVWEADASGMLLRDSPSWSAYTGQPSDEVMRFGWLDVVHPDDRAFAKEQWRSAVRDKTNLNAEWRMHHVSGGWRWTNVRAVPMLEPDGTVRKWVGMNIDITERKEAELALKEQDRRKDEFLAMLAHELRNPLAPIRTAIKVLDMMNCRSAEAARTREMIARQVAHMARMIDDLLDVSRIARGKAELRKGACDLAQIVRDAVNDYRPSLQSCGLDVSLDVPDEPLWIDGDATRLSQIIGNLLHNACKFTDPGGHVEVRCERQSATNQAIVTVRDTGIGMERAMLQRVFETFSQADRSLERSRGGLGLGLALVKGLVDLHGGSVEAQSEGPGKGSTFIVRLPISQAHMPHDEAPAKHVAPSPPQARPMRVLVIEDNPDAADIMQSLLSLMGYHAEVAYSGRSGLAAAREIRPDVVLCDLGLPEMDGFAVARALRADPATQKAYLIAQTGYGQPEDRRMAREAGFDLHMTKPIDPTELERVLATLPPRRPFTRAA